jgi:hypothetical protein
LRSTPLRGEERREEEKNPPTPQGGRRAPRAAATGPQAEVIRHWIQEWARTRLGAEWKIAPRDCAHFSALLTQWDVREVCDRITRLLDSADSFHLRAASPGILEQNFNQLAVEVRVAPKFTSITDQNLQNLEEARRIVAAKSNESEYLL